MEKKQKLIAIIIAAVVGAAGLITVLVVAFGWGEDTPQTKDDPSTQPYGYSEAEKKTNPKTDTTESQTTTEPTTTRSIEEEKQEYISSCESYTFNQIARNPSKYEGKRAKFTGEVIQVMESYGIMYTLRVNITENEYGYYEDTIYVTYFPKDDNEPKILEDDIVTMYGELDGETTYESVFGQSVTLPNFNCEYIDILTE